MTANTNSRYGSPSRSRPNGERYAGTSELRDFAALNLDDVHLREVLAALLAGRALLDEGDVAVDAFDLDVPQRLLDRFRLRLAGRLDRFDDRVDPVPAAEAFGQAADVVLLLVLSGVLYQPRLCENACTVLKVCVAT